MSNYFYLGLVHHTALEVAHHSLPANTLNVLLFIIIFIQDFAYKSWVQWSANQHIYRAPFYYTSDITTVLFDNLHELTLCFMACL